MKTKRERKKKRKKKSAKSECSCSHEVKEAAEILADELGGDLVDIKEYVKAATSVIKAFVRPKPVVIPQRVVPFIRPTKPAPIVPATPKPAPVPAPKTPKPVPAPKPEKPVPSPKPGRPVKPETKPKPKPDTKVLKPAADKLVKLDTKTGAITDVSPQGVKIPGKTAIGNQQTPPGGTGGGTDGGTPRRGGRLECPPRLERMGLCKLKPFLKDPVADPGTLKL